MDVEELRAAARTAPEHDAEPMPPVSSEKAIVDFVTSFAGAMKSQVTAAVVALDDACEKLTGKKPDAGEGARILFESAALALGRAFVGAIAPAPPLSKEALMVKEAAIVAAATATSVADVVDGMKRLGDSMASPMRGLADIIKPAPRAWLWMDGFPVMATHDVRETMTMGGEHVIEFTFTPDLDAAAIATRALTAIRKGSHCSLRYGERDFNVDHEFMGRFADAMYDGIMVGLTVNVA